VFSHWPIGVFTVVTSRILIGYVFQVCVLTGGGRKHERVLRKYISIKE